MTSSLPLVFVSLACGVSGQLALKAGMTGVGEVGANAISQPVSLVARAASNPLIVGGLALYVLGAISWMAVLSRVPLSFAYPLLALGYAVTPVLAWLVLRESLSPMRWVGIAVISLGVILVTRS